MFPQEMVDLPQWVVSGTDKRPYYYKDGLYASSVIDSNTWMDYTTACNIASQYNLQIGFVLSESDPFVCIDFDIKDAETLDKNGLNYPESMWTPELIIKQQDTIINSIDTYKEVSVSGKGIHLWIRGQSGPGTRRGGIEVYSKERFIICTGQSFSRIERINQNGIIQSNIIRQNANLSINAEDEFLEGVLKALKTSNSYKGELIEVAPVEDDNVVIDRAMNASNGDKFTALCRGEWESLGYPSQSEADLSLMSMICFYSKSNSQCRRIFRLTELGRRDKAVKNDVYINRTLIGIRGRQQNEEELSLRSQLEGMLFKKELEFVDNAVKQIEKETIEDIIKPVEACLFNSRYDFTQTFEVDYPPGMLGEVAKYIYRTSPRPVKEVSIVGALGFFAGLAGRGYHINQTGLNVYLILIAKSAVGKESMHTGISYLLKNFKYSLPNAAGFFHFGDLSSGPALMKTIAVQRSFLHVNGEFGRKLLAMSGVDGSNPAMQSLRTSMTDLYQKSGPNAMVGGIKYSDKEKNVEAAESLAYSMIGESTPETLYGAITEEMMEDGFLSRFTMLRYDGERVPLNHNVNIELPEWMYNNLNELIGLYISANAMEGSFTEIKLDTSAWLLQFDFNDYCDKKINGYEKESYRQMWNRAHLKSLRFAGLLAVANDARNPYVTIDMMRWAINIVLVDIRDLTERLESGGLGTSDDGRMSKLKTICLDYLKANDTALHIDKRMQLSSIIPRKYLQMRTCSLKTFTQHKLGGTGSLNNAIQSLIDNGDLVEIPRLTLQTEYGTHGKAYRICKL